MKRTTISKRTRFEVFKRDSFKCQYCGRPAPEVVLQVDHIIAVANGGNSEILNLVTSCFDCNSGKSDKPISEQAALARQKGQLDSLQQRREQIEMMAQWQMSLLSIESVALVRCDEMWTRIANGYELNDQGKRTIEQHIRKFGPSEVMEAMRISARYLVIGPNGRYTKTSVELAFDKIGGICTVRKRASEDPDIDGLYRIRAGLRYRLKVTPQSSADRELISKLRSLHSRGYKSDELRKQFSDVSGWREFDNRFEILSAGAE